MKIAYVVSDLTYPPREGLHQQTILLISSLLRRGHQVDVFGFVKDQDKLDEQALFEETGIRFQTQPLASRNSVLAQAFSQLPSKLLGNTKRAAAPLLKDLVEGEYDVFHLEGISACLVLDRRSARRAVHSFVDPGSRRFLRMAKNRKGVAVRTKALVAALTYFVLESLVQSRQRVCHVVSESDQRYVRRCFPRSKVQAIPVMLPPEFNDASVTTSAARPTEALEVFFFCDLRLQHMRQALNTILREILSRDVPQTTHGYKILGRVARDDMIEETLRGKNFELISWVDDYQSALSACDILILPDSVGTGLKNRAIQGLWSGAAVLGTGVAFEGIPVVKDTHAAIAVDANDFAEQFSRLMTDAGLRQRLGRNGHNFAVEHYSEARVTDAWESLYASLIDAENARKKCDPSFRSLIGG